MNKQEFLGFMKEKGLVESKVDGERVLATFQEAIKLALEEGNDVKLTGFMNFEIKSVEERTFSNPKNPDEKIVKEAHQSVKVKLSKKIKELV